MNQVFYKGSSGNIYSPTRKLGQGGEGTVYEIKEDSSLVLKIYTEPLSAEKTGKLLYMMSMGSAELTRFAAWPSDVVSSGGSVCGFVMKKLEAHVPLHKLFSPMDRKKMFPDKGYDFLVHVARNLAAAFSKIHSLGIVAGDVNEANILVNPGGLVSFIDCDSFQIRQGDRYYFCEVGIPRYTAPELLAKGTFTHVVRSDNTDNFSLATLIFQLLFLGRAPFTGVNPGTMEIDEETAIRSGEFAYSLRRQQKKLYPAKNSVDIRWLSPGISHAFHIAFEENQRPAAAQWVTELGIQSAQLKSCAESKMHAYPNTLSECPWCMFRNKYNIYFFLDDSYLKAIPELSNMEQFINGFRVEQLGIKKLTEHFTAPAGMQAAPIAKNLKRLKQRHWLILALMTAILMLLWFGLSWLFSFAGILVFIYKDFAPTHKKLQAELLQRREAVNTLLQSLRAIIQQHNNLPEASRYQQQTTKLSHLINDFKALAAEFSMIKKRIEEQHYNRKLSVFLQQFGIRDHAITGFGPAKKLLLYNHGIYNAADIDRLSQIRIPGIGPKNIRVLTDWQRQMGTSFSYTPDINAINYDIGMAVQDIGRKRQRLEADIKNEYRNVQLLRAHVQATTQKLETQYTGLARQLYQAELDLKAFRKFMGVK